MSTELDIPGTARLFSENGESLDTQIHLIPAPSTDPEDPLNWTQNRKYFHLFCILLYTLNIGIITSVGYSIYGPLGDAWGLSLDELNAGQGYMYLFIGVCCLVTTPLALALGKKPVYVVSSIATAAINLWVIFGGGNAQWIVCRLLVGLSTSPQFALVEISVADIFFMHERAFGLGLYCTSLYVGVTLGPLLSGYVNDGLGWKAVIWFSSGFSLLTGIFMFFFCEETSFYRDPSTEHLVHHDASETERQESESGDIAKKEESNAVEPPRPVPVDPTTRLVRTPWPGPRFWRFAKPHPYSGGIMLRGLVQPVMLLKNPILIWCAVQFGMYQVYFNFISSLTFGVLSEPPYNFSPSAVGLAFLGPLLASIPGSVIGGRLADYIAVRLAKRNHGISQAEDKLWVYIIVLILMIPGLLMMGLGPYYGVHWIVFILGGSIVNFCGPIATTISLAYAFDSYHPIRPDATVGPQASAQDASPYLLSVILLGMTIAFGFGYAITPWCFTWGYKNFGISSALTSIIINGSAFLFIWKGRQLRRYGEAYYRKTVNW